MDHLIRITLIIVISTCTWSFPLDTEPKHVPATARRNASVCHYKGRSHTDGDVINVDEPCLLCRCKKGALTCSLRICTDLPDPPPAGCYIVHNANQCCPQMLCQTEKKESDIEVRTISGPPTDMEVCVVNGSLYAEGSALESTDQCEYCYCIRGQQKCIKPKCPTPFVGCKPIYTQKSCCPTQYDCREKATNVSNFGAENSGCEIHGFVYAEGAMLPTNNSNCETCYCMKGEVRCASVTCDTEFTEDCEPVYKPGQCCPSSYICSKTIMGLSENSIRLHSKRLDLEDGKNETENGEEIGTTTSDTGNGTESMMTTNLQEETMSDSTTFANELDENIQSRVDETENITESGFQKKIMSDTTPEMTTIETEESTASLLTSSPVATQSNIIDISSRNHIKLISENRTSIVDDSTTNFPTLEEIYSSSPQIEDDYDAYDYNEPRLPPSLPNLIIFPFVAADAVVKDEESPKTVNYDESSIKRVGTEVSFYKDYFSPPIRTEGGFVPKQPPGITDRYQEKGGTFSSIQKPDIGIPSITLPPKANTDQCLLKGRLHEHGELLSEPGDCQSCICYYGDVICQEVICPPIREGCRRSSEKDPKSCCGKIICDVKESEEFIHGVEKTSKKPVTVADVKEVTPNPFKDVIRTEPAPDLPSLMSDLLPIYGEEQTKKPVTVTYKNLVVDYYPDFLITTTRDDIRKKNYKNPLLYTTEVYPHTEPETSVNVTYPTQPTVTSSISPSLHDLEGDNSKYSYGKIELVRTSVRPIITAATQPSRLFDYYTIEEYKPTPKQQATRRTRPPGSIRPVKKTTEASIHAKDDQHTPPAKSSNSSKHKHTTKTKSKTATTIQAKETQTKSTVDKMAADDSFSLDSVLRFFFNADATTTPSPPPSTRTASTTRKATKKDVVKKFTASTAEERVRQTTKTTAPDFKYKELGGKIKSGSDGEESSKRHFSDTSNKKIGNILKLAGCNIYGRMYRVGKIIAELSNPCMECVCTDLGVECNPLLC